VSTPEPPASSRPISIPDLPPFGSPDAFLWEPLRPGVDAAWIYGKDSEGPRAALLRYQPGAVVSEHEHLGFEHIFVLAGSQTDGTTTYPTGTLSVFPPGWSHEITSGGGCLVLAIWTGPLAFKEE